MVLSPVPVRSSRLERLPLAALVAAGIALRVAVGLLAENRLDHDEATVGVMALDVLEGKALPFFFYGKAYNGGGALEAYLGAIMFSLFGPRPLVLKFAVLLFWVPAGFLFAAVCRRHLPRRQAWFAVLFFSLGTPFFLEWGLKARGGYAETLLFSSVLLWLAVPPAVLARRPFLQGAVFGLSAGAALWASEMILILALLAALWMISEARAPACPVLLLGLGIGMSAGIAPLWLYNLTHDWAHFKESAVYAAFTQKRAPLSLSEMALSVHFALGPLWWLLGLYLLVTARSLFHAREALRLPHIALLHTVLYLTAYWLSGLRYLPVPPSRVLYALAPSLAILFANPVRGSRWERALPGLAFAGWIATWIFALTAWIGSGRPREAGTWRGSWSLINGEELYQVLADRGADFVYTTYFTAWPLRFAARSRLHRDPLVRPMRIFWSLPQPGGAGDGNAAFVFRRGSPLEQHVSGWLLINRLAHQRTSCNGFVVYTGISVGRLHANAGLVPVFGRDWPPPPRPLDGFN